MQANTLQRLRCAQKLGLGLVVHSKAEERELRDVAAANELPLPRIVFRPSPNQERAA